MVRFGLFAVAAAAATVAGLAPAGTSMAAPPGAAPHAPHGHHPAAQITAPAHPSAAVQWTRGPDGKVSGLVRYPSGLIAHVAQRNAKPVAQAAAVRDAAAAAAVQSRSVRTMLAAPAAAQGTVKGRVTDSQHAPLAGAVVEAFTGASAEPVVTTATNANGHYSLTLPAGSYAFGFDGRDATGGNSDATGYVGTNDDIELAAGEDVIRNARLQPGAQLRVRVTDRAGNPLAGVSPFLQPVMPYVQNPASGLLIFVSFETDDLTRPDGTFTFRGLPSDAALVCFATETGRPTGGEHDALGYAGRCSRRPIAPAPGSSAGFPTVELNAAPGGTIAGTVMSADGDPIADAEISAGGQLDDEFATTDSAGTYRITGLPPGSYKVCADTQGASGAPRLGHTPGCHPGRVAVHRGSVSRADISVHRGGAITGTITGPTGAPVDGATVLATGSGKRFGFGFTDAHGKYRVNGLPTGSYRVCVDTSGAFDPDNPTGDRIGCYQHKTPVSVHTGSAHDRIDVRLRLGGAIGGRVTDASGAGVAGVDVSAGLLPDFAGGGDAVTDANGDYRITGLQAGSYAVCLLSFSLGTGGAQRCDPNPVDVHVGDTTALDESLAPPPGRGSIAVTVRDDQGRRVQGVDVAVLKPCPKPGSFSCATEPLFGHHGGAKLVYSTMVDNTGVARSDDRKPGNYAVCLFAYYGVTTAGAPPTGYTDRCAGRTYTVTVQAGATARLHLTLHLGGRVEGRITDRSGHPVSHARVRVADAAPTDFIDLFADDPFAPPDGESPSRDAVTHKGGTFSIRGVRPGARQVCAHFPQGSLYKDSCAAARAHVTAGATTQVPDLAVRRFGAISGVVRDAAGHPLQLAVVLVFGTGRRKSLTDVEPVRSDGHYRTAGLSAGRYIVCFAAPHRVVECYRGVPWHVKHRTLPPPGAEQVHVSDGRITTGIGAKLPRRK